MYSGLFFLCTIAVLNTGLSLKNSDSYVCISPLPLPIQRAHPLLINIAGFVSTSKFTVDEQLNDTRFLLIMKIIHYLHLFTIVLGTVKDNHNENAFNLFNKYAIRYHIYKALKVLATCNWFIGPSLATNETIGEIYAG